MNAPLRTIVASSFGAGLCGFGIALAQSVDTRLSRQMLEADSRERCEGVSVVVERCADPGNAARKTGTAATRPSADAPSDSAVATSGPSSGSQRLEGVTVTGNRGRADVPLSPEAVLQKALAPAVPPSGPRVAHQGAAGTRYECYEKCVGTACCIEVRTTPNPARESNLIGR